MLARVVPVDGRDPVVFGATEDLARRKLISALRRRRRIGVGRRDPAQFHVCARPLIAGLIARPGELGQ